MAAVSGRAEPRVPNRNEQAINAEIRTGGGLCGVRQVERVGQIIDVIVWDGGGRLENAAPRLILGDIGVAIGEISKEEGGNARKAGGRVLHGKVERLGKRIGIWVN